MKVILELTSNGIHLITKEKYKEDKQFEQNVSFVTEDENSEVRALQRKDFLYELIDLLGWYEGRYNSHRLVISIEPGDKYEN